MSSARVSIKRGISESDSVFFSRQHRSNKRRRMKSSSSCCSDSGVSTMSSNSLMTFSKNHDWPTLALISKPDKLILNGKNRRRFPDPVTDKSVLLACFDNDKNMLKLRQKQTNLELKNAVFRQRIQQTDEALQDEENCIYFINLDYVEFDDLGNDDLNNNRQSIMLCDVRDHIIASNSLPADEMSGYWVRLFGAKSKYVLYISLWKSISNAPMKKNKEKRKKMVTGDDYMKIGEITIELFNDGINSKKARKKSKAASMSKGLLWKQDLQGSDFTPLFCSKEQYTQITTIFNECRENGDQQLFDEMYNKFMKDLNDETQTAVELKLLLYCEKSLFYSSKGDFIDARKILQKVVDRVISKSPNKVFLLNRAYLSLATSHTIEGNYGTAEECLNVLQKDKKNGIPYEDLVLLYMLFGIISMNFARKIPKMSMSLLLDSFNWLQKALKLIEKNGLIMSLLYKYYHLQLLFVQYYIIRINSDTQNTDIPTLLQNISSHMYIVEAHFHVMTKRLKSLFFVTFAQVNIIEKKFSDAANLLKESLEIANNMNFYEIKSLCDIVKEMLVKKEYDECVEANNTDNGSISKELSSSSTTVCGADMSSV